MLTRGRYANHLYLQVVGDGDPHAIIRPDTIAPRTPTETLQQILARDEAPVSASTLLRELNDPGPRLFQAVQRYSDGLHVAAEQLVGPQIVAELDQADQYIPGLTTEPAWPTLRARLLALAAETGEHPLRHLLTAAAGRDLETAGDMAAVLYWRLPALTPTDPGPLPWLPGIPETLHDHPVWGAYLAMRSQLVADLAGQVQDHACQGDAQPAWAPPGSHPSTALIGEIAVWRAANGIKPQDPRPTGGGGQLETLPALWKQHLDRDIARSTDSSANARFDERQSASTAHRRGTPTASARTKQPNSVRTGQPHPVADRRAAAKRLFVRPIQSWRAAIGAAGFVNRSHGTRRRAFLAQTGGGHYDGGRDALGVRHRRRGRRAWINHPPWGINRPPIAGLGSPISLDRAVPFQRPNSPRQRSLRRIDPALAPRADPLVCYAPRQQLGLTGLPASATIPNQCRLVDRRDIKPLLPPALEHTARLLHRIDPTGGQLRPSAMARTRRGPGRARAKEMRRPAGPSHYCRPHQAAVRRYPTRPCRVTP